MADPELQIRGGPGHPGPEKRGGGTQKKFFTALRASVWSKTKGWGPGPPAPSLDPPQHIGCDWILEYGKFLLVESGILGFGIRYSTQGNPESRIADNWNPEFNKYN